MCTRLRWFCAVWAETWLAMQARLGRRRGRRAMLAFVTAAAAAEEPSTSSLIVCALSAANLTNADLGLADDVRAVEGKRGKKRKT